MIELYPSQQNAVDVATAKSPVRHMYSFGTGCGKTPTAIRTAKAVRAQRILVVCPAIVRCHWRDQFAAWWPSAEPVGVIDVGRARKLSKRASRVRDAAYCARVQIVSYDLLGEVDVAPWDFIIVDEAHSLGSPLSAQSRLTSALFQANATAHALLLTATPIPTLLRQLWNPLYLLEGDVWGKPSKTGDVSWEFGARYCGLVRTEYGMSIGNTPTAEQLAKLRTDLAPVMSRLTMEDVAPNMPPLNVAPIHTRKADDRFYRDWIQALEGDIHHACVLTHLRATAARVREIAVQAGWPVVYVDGGIPATLRAQMLHEWAAQPRAILVGTYDSLSVGIRLTAAQKALIAEFSASPGSTAQTLGRFGSVAATTRPIVQVVIQSGEDHLRAALLDRVSAVNSAIRGSGNETAILDAFQPQSLSSADLSNLMSDIFGNLSGAAEWAEGASDE